MPTEPTTPHAAKTARVETRTTPAKKALYQRAAAMRGLTFTEFVERSLDEAAERAQKDLESMQLSRRDAEAFCDALVSDAEPGEHLQAAANRYRHRA